MNLLSLFSFLLILTTTAMGSAVKNETIVKIQAEIVPEETPVHKAKSRLLEPVSRLLNGYSDRVFNKFSTVAVNCPEELDSEEGDRAELLHLLAFVNAQRSEMWQPPVEFWLRLNLNSNITFCTEWAFQANQLYPEKIFQGILSNSAHMLPLAFATLPQNPKMTNCHDVWTKNYTSQVEAVHQKNLQFGFLTQPYSCEGWTNLLPESVIVKFDVVFLQPEILQQKIFWAHVPELFQPYKLAPIFSFRQAQRFVKFESCAVFDKQVDIEEY